MKKFKVKLAGKTPYMQHRMDDAKLEVWEKNRKLIIERDDVSKEDLTRALFHAYIGDDEQFYIPAEQVRRSLINAGAFMKSKVGNAKKSMKNVVAAMFMIEQDRIPFKGDFEIDKRSAVNNAVKARVIVIRPCWKNWTCEFTLLVDNDTITEETITQLFEYSGNYVGIGSYRPEKNGYFGRFEAEVV